MLAKVSHILPFTLIRRERLLPAPGRILVRKGQKVTATDPIGEYLPRQDFYLVDVARVLGIPAERVNSFIQCEAGAKIAQNDIIAGPTGFTRKLIRSPKSGKVILAGGGQVLIELDEQALVVPAGFSGEVVDLISDRGVVMETTGALIQGVWGNGLVDFGPLVNLAASPDDELTLEKLDMSQRGAVILAGYCRDSQVLERASQLPIRGLILGGLDTALKDVLFSLAFPVIILEGFGKFAINLLAHKLLVSHEQREISLNAEQVDVFKGKQPEIVISLPTSGQLIQPQKSDYYASQKKVRVLNSNHARSIGTITRLKGVMELPSGIRTQVAEVCLDQTGEEIVFPLQNLEILA